VKNNVGIINVRFDPCLIEFDSCGFSAGIAIIDFCSDTLPVEFDSCGFSASRIPYIGNSL
jgi:hypothetical protein